MTDHKRAGVPEGWREALSEAAKQFEADALKLRYSSHGQKLADMAKRCRQLLAAPAPEAEGCGACGDGCNGGACRLASESPKPEAEKAGETVDFTLQVALSQDGDSWIASSDAIDYVASGADGDEAKRNFARGLLMTLAEHVKRQCEPRRLLSVADADAAAVRLLAARVLKEYWDVRPADPDLDEDIAAMVVAVKKYRLLPSHPVPPAAGQAEGVEALAWETWLSVVNDTEAHAGRKPAETNRIAVEAVAQAVARHLAAQAVKQDMTAPQDGVDRARALADELDELRSKHQALFSHRDTAIYLNAYTRWEGAAREFVSSKGGEISALLRRRASAQQPSAPANYPAKPESSFSDTSGEGVGDA